jgi:hypothetical protein
MVHRASMRLCQVHTQWFLFQHPCLAIAEQAGRDAMCKLAMNRTVLAVCFLGFAFFGI